MRPDLGKEQPADEEAAEHEEEVDTSPARLAPQPLWAGEESGLVRRVKRVRAEHEQDGDTAEDVERRETPRNSRP